MAKFKVSFYQDTLYEVLEKYNQDGDIWEDVYEWESVYKGGLADCEAYIRLKQNEEVDFN